MVCISQRMRFVCSYTFCVLVVCGIKYRICLIGSTKIGSSSSTKTRTKGTRVSHTTRNHFSVSLSNYTDMSSKLSKLFQSFSVGLLDWVHVCSRSRGKRRKRREMSSPKCRKSCLLSIQSLHRRTWSPVWRTAKSRSPSPRSEDA